MANAEEYDAEEITEYECPDSDTAAGLGGRPGVSPLDHKTTRPQGVSKAMRLAHDSPRCAHIRPSGMRCGSPAMRGIEYCYYHKRTHLGPRLLYPTLTMLEDGHGVQAALMEVLCGIVDGSLTHKDAALMLYGLATAASNLKRVQDVDPAEVAIEPAPEEEKRPEGVFERQRDEWSPQEKREIEQFMSSMEIKKLKRQTQDQIHDEEWMAHLKRVEEKQAAEEAASR